MYEMILATIRAHQNSSKNPYLSLEKSLVLSLKLWPTLLEELVKISCQDECLDHSLCQSLNTKRIKKCEMASII